MEQGRPASLPPISGLFHEVEVNLFNSLQFWISVSCNQTCNLIKNLLSVFTSELKVLEDEHCLSYLLRSSSSGLIGWFWRSNWTQISFSPPSEKTFLMRHKCMEYGSSTRKFMLLLAFLDSVGKDGGLQAEGQGSTHTDSREGKVVMSPWTMNIGQSLVISYSATGKRGPVGIPPQAIPLAPIAWGQLVGSRLWKEFMQMG